MASKSKTYFPGLVLKAASLPSNPETGTVARDTDGTLKQHLSGSWEAVGGGLTPVAVTSTGTVKVNTVELCAIAASITRTLPPLPVSGEPVSWKIIDSGNADASKKITIAPASGEKFDRPGFAADDTISIDYAGGWVAGYAEAGATGWTIQTQATTTVQPATPSLDGTVKKSLVQVKTSTGTWGSDATGVLAFSNLTVGRLYKITVRLGRSLKTASGQYALLTAVHNSVNLINPEGGANLGGVGVGDAGALSETGEVIAGAEASAIFTAATTSLSIDAKVNGGNVLGAYARLEEINDYETTTAW